VKFFKSVKGYVLLNITQKISFIFELIKTFKDIHISLEHRSHHNKNGMSFLYFLQNSVELLTRVIKDELRINELKLSSCSEMGN